MNVPEQRLDPHEERQIANRILALETELRGVLETIPACREILGSRRGRMGRTRAAAVNRLEEAVSAAVSADPRGTRQIRAQWEETQALRWRLALSATRVAYREAHRLASNPVLAQPDLVQEGLIGLLDAAKRFEPSHDNRFATYARWWVRAHMTRAIDLGRLVHLSAGACEQLRNLKKQIRFHEMAGASWTPSELAAELGLDVERTRALLGVGGGQSPDESNDEGQPIASTQLADESGSAPDETVAKIEDVDRLRTALETALPERQRFILIHRYGIDREPRTLAEIAANMHLSRERVRQLERDSLQRLREAGESPPRR